jgi:uroporphyrinogen-III synthase
VVAEPASFGVVVTRGEGPDGPLTRLLEGKGARVLQWGSIAFAPPEDPVPFLEALGELDRYDWIYFSSPRAVEAVVSRVDSPPLGVRVAVVGPSTGKLLEGAGWPVHRMAEDGSGEGVVEAFRQVNDAEGVRVFFPASAIARDVVPKGLMALGAQVDQVTAYRLVTLPLDSALCQRSLDRGEVQMVTFASPSAMEALREGLGEDLFARLATGVPAAAMGATTAGALRGAGWRTIEVAEEPTLEGLAAAAVRGNKGKTNR